MEDPTWALVDVALWSTLELVTGVICVSLPSLRAIFLRLRSVHTRRAESRRSFSATRSPQSDSAVKSAMPAKELCSGSTESTINLTEYSLPQGLNHPSPLSRFWQAIHSHNSHHQQKQGIVIHQTVEIQHELVAFNEDLEVAHQYPRPLPAFENEPGTPFYPPTSPFHSSLEPTHPLPVLGPLAVATPPNARPVSLSASLPPLPPSPDMEAPASQCMSADKPISLKSTDITSLDANGSGLLSPRNENSPPQETNVADTAPQRTSVGSLFTPERTPRSIWRASRSRSAINDVDEWGSVPKNRRR